MTDLNKLNSLQIDYTKPTPLYVGADQAAIEALTGIALGSEAFAIAEDTKGVLKSGGWDWSGGGVATHIADTTAAHAASAISYAGGTGMSATDVEAAIDELANEKVNNTGNETIAGIKTFSSDPLIPDEAYNATNWNGVLEPPTKNAVRDKIESLVPAKQMLMGTGLSSTVPINSTRYLIINQAIVLQALGFNLEITAPCTISNLSVTTNGAQPANNSLVITVNKNNVNTALTVTIPAGSAAGTFTSGASVSFAAGDFIVIEADNNDTTAVSAPITRHSLLVTFT